MEELQVGPFESAIEGSLPRIWSVAENKDGNLFAACRSGHIYSIDKRQYQEYYFTGGEPTSMIFEGSSTAYIADMAHQRILCLTDIEGRPDVTDIVKDYEGKPLLGPNCLALNEHNNYLYFTDSGPLGETSIANPVGSVFAADLELLVLKPIALKCLAYPSGIAISYDGRNIYVAEMNLNRVLRIAQNPPGVHHLSVFYQFTSRFGPSAVAVSENGFIYVANYDFSEYSKNGLISILSPEGTFVNSFAVPSAPEITSLQFSKVKSNILYITEATNNTCYKVSIPSDHI
jgi:sugar lactone lactonase YvrE